jgi:hypothetical protein
MNTATDQAIDWVRDHLPIESGAARDQFVKRNPHYQGANWDDILEIILDADADLVWTQPLTEVDADFPANVLESAVTTTMAWAVEAFVNEQTATERIATVRNIITTYEQGEDHG